VALNWKEALDTIIKRTIQQVVMDIQIKDSLDTAAAMAVDMVDTPKARAMAMHKVTGTGINP